MKVLKRIREIIFRARQIYKDKGGGFLVRAVLFRLRPKNARQSPAPLKDWLEYYQNKSTIQVSQVPEQDASRHPKVSVLILTYNNLPVTQICLNSIYKNTGYPNFEIIVVDNASSDETPLWLGKFARSYPNMKVILNEKNLGFSAGNNQAVREADGEFIIFLNNDTVVTRGWMERLVSYAQPDPQIGLIGPVTNSIGNEARIPVDYTSPAEMEAFAAMRASRRRGEAFEIRMLALYCVLARRDQFISLGGLDERFGVGMFEDDDLAVRYHQAGLKVICVEDVFIHHFQSMSFSRLKKEHYNRLFEENRRKYEEKWGRKWEPYHYRRELLGARGNPENVSRKNKYGILSYRCNICGRLCKTSMYDLERETRSCDCGSTVRSRSIIHLLSMELFGISMALPDFPLRRDLRGMGMSDATYTKLLAQKTGYVNTYYHKEPRFDITGSLDPQLEGKLDFLISTEVFEHIAPPVSPAFVNARRLLKSTGVLIFTVPYTLDPETREHFPDLFQYEMVQKPDGRMILKNTTREGREQVFEELIFHGGAGTTLEMRVFSLSGLMKEFELARFKVKICAEPCWEFGIHWKDAWSLPMVATPLVDRSF